jgi:hypothetical protein
VTAPARIVRPVGGSPKKPREQALAELAHFVDHYDPRHDSVPRRLDPSHVLEFLQARLEQGRPAPGTALRWVDLALFYDVRDILPGWLEWLDRSEANDGEYRTSAILDLAIGIIGEGEIRERGRRHYQRLIASPRAEDKLLLLLTTSLAFAPPETMAPLLARTDDVLAILRSRLDPKDDGAHYNADAVRVRDTEDFRNVTLQRAEGALTIEQEILNQIDRAERLRQLAAIYARYDLRYEELTTRWALHRLLREAQASPDAQLDAIAAFRTLLEGPEPLTAEPLAMRRRRLVSAIDYLGGELSADEAREKHPTADRVDLLSLDS